MGSTAVAMLVVATSLLALLARAEATNENAYARLLDDLFDDDNYNKDAIPMLKPAKDNADNALNVELGVSPVDLDYSSDGVVTSNAWVRTSWNDFRLSWDPAQYDGLQIVRVPASSIWIPDFEVYNAPSFGDGTFSKQISQAPTLALVYSSGKVLWIPPMTIRSYCHKAAAPDLPQDCAIRIGSWTYDAYHLNLTAFKGRDYLHLEEFKYSSGNSRYVLVQQKGNALVTKFYPGGDEPYQHFNYEFQLQRAFTINKEGLREENKLLPFPLEDLMAKYEEGETMI